MTIQETFQIILSECEKKVNSIPKRQNLEKVIAGLPNEEIDFELLWGALRTFTIITGYQTTRSKAKEKSTQLRTLTNQLIKAAKKHQSKFPSPAPLPDCTGAVLFILIQCFKATYNTVVNGIPSAVVILEEVSKSPRVTDVFQVGPKKKKRKPKKEELAQRIKEMKVTDFGRYPMN